MQVVNAERHHITQFIYSSVRQVDIDEWTLGSGMSYKDMLTTRLDLETQKVRALLDEGGLCIALWGVEPDDGHGNVWLIANTAAEKVGKRIHRFWPYEVGLMHMDHTNLRALAYSANELHIKWLTQIGFKHWEDHKVGPGRVPFSLYVRTQPCVHLSH